MYRKGWILKDQRNLVEFTNDGLEIIDFFLRHRQEHFQKHGWKLLGIEMPILLAPHEDYPNVKLMGKLDLVMFWAIDTNPQQNTIKKSKFLFINDCFLHLIICHFWKIFT